LPPFVLALAAIAGLSLQSFAPPVQAQQTATPKRPQAAGVPQVPPLPEGTPEQLMAFVEGLTQSNVRPKSREEMMGYMRDVAAVSVQAADRILAEVKPADPLHDRAAKMKLQCAAIFPCFTVMTAPLRQQETQVWMTAWAGGRKAMDQPSGRGIL
jgi:hypothetical protein